MFAVKRFGSLPRTASKLVRFCPTTFALAVVLVVANQTAGHAQTVVPPAGPICSVAGTTATCTGGLSAGVDANGPTITTLNVNNLTQNLGNTGAADSINFATTDTDATLVLDLGGFQGLNTASPGDVVDVSVFDTGNVSITSTGDLTTSGFGGGIVGSVDGLGNGGVTVVSQGNISTQNFGINAFTVNAGDVSIQSTGNVTVNNPLTGLPGLFSQPSGIIAGVQNIGNIVINSNGNVTVTGLGLNSGIRANSFVGAAITDVTIESNGDINVSGGTFNNIGINAGTVTGNLSITSTGNIVADTGILSFNDFAGAGSSTIV
ncbi:MAG: hypothetical protein AAF641_14520 [Pseudomonadota bacterium]